MENYICNFVKIKVLGADMAGSRLIYELKPGEWELNFDSKIFAAGFRLS